ncbi:integrase, catalytic region, zinc finger, CCHC-type containing protein [Tanacetum coccineum]
MLLVLLSLKINTAKIDSGLTVPVFKQGDDPIDAINKMMSFLSIVISSCFLTTNNQLRNSSNPRQLGIIHDRRVTIQPVQERQSLFAARTSGTRANISRSGGNNSGQQRVVNCFKCQGEGHIAIQCPKPKRKTDATWFRDKVLLEDLFNVLHGHNLDIKRRLKMAADVALIVYMAKHESLFASQGEPFTFAQTIKALRSDQGGEYISQEFKDYLKACGIVQQLTPPCTTQHNETATRILNMVPTKKVDKTPYELWYGKVPNLSYLKVWGCEALVKRDMLDKLQSVKYAEFLEKNLLSKEVESFKPPQEEVVLVRRLDLNKTEGASTREEVKRMQNAPYASAVGEPHWTAVKTILKIFKEILKIITWFYDGNPEAEVRVDCYCNAGFETNRDDIKS